jgi:omega-6 fatty acid desaturase (delta-12 desaturase)
MLYFQPTTIVLRPKGCRLGVLPGRNCLIALLCMGMSQTEADRLVMRKLAPHRDPNWGCAVWQLATTLGGFAVCWAGMWWCFQSGWYWLMSCLVPLTGAFLVRLFILQHDCGHRSFFRSRRANDVCGSFLSVLTLTPYHCWRREHAVHHATSGDLDRRGLGGEIFVMTLGEYQQAGRWKRFGYRLYRNPLVLLLIAPWFHFLVRQRFVGGLPPTWKKERASVHLTNLAILGLTLLMAWLVGWRALVLIHFPVIVIGASLGVWLFYMQHQYENAYWRPHGQWDYVAAALDGSSHYRLPKVLQWFSANIGLHHIHHLDSRIPNYRLQRCVDEHPELKATRALSIWESLSCLSMRLWDEAQGRMIGFPRGV